MTAGTVILWRHGLTEYNLSNRMQGQVDIPLGLSGLAHAARAAVVLAEHRPTAIVCSDLSRARSTAEMLAELAALDVRYDARLRERSFGAFEGLTRDEIDERWPEHYAAWRRGEDVAEIGIEPRSAVGDRVADCVAAEAAALTAEDVLVVVGHGAAIASGVTRLVGLPPDGWFGLSAMDNCHWARLRRNTPRHPPWFLAAYNVGVL